jgi:hypothetical protein
MTRPPPPPTWTPPPRRKIPTDLRWLLVIGWAGWAVAAIAALGWLSAASNEPPTPPPRPAAVTAAPPASATAPPAAPTTARPAGTSDGTWQVPAEVKPGTYHTQGANTAEGRSNCYWARLGALSGDTDDVLANGNSAGPMTVTIARTDAGFQSEGCQPWQPVRR